MDRFVDHIIPHVPGCPRTLIKREVLRSAIEFCTDSHIWQQDTEEEVLADADEISLTVTSGAAVTGVQLSIDDAGFNEYTRSATTITLDDERTNDTTFDVTAFLKPTRAATSLPAILYNDWSKAIESCAKANLMLMPDKKWTNPNAANIQQRIYLHELGEAKLKARKTNTQTRLRIMPRAFI